MSEHPGPLTAFERHRNATAAARLAVLEHHDAARAEHQQQQQRQQRHRHHTTLFASMSRVARALATAEAGPLDTRRLQAHADDLEAHADALVASLEADGAHQRHRTGPWGRELVHDRGQTIMVLWSQTMMDPAAALAAAAPRPPPTPLSAATFAAWPAADAGTECTVCMEPVGKDDGVQVPTCSHGFHRKCLWPWLAQGKRTCPNCRKDVPSDAR